VTLGAAITFAQGIKFIKSTRAVRILKIFFFILFPPPQFKKALILIIAKLKKVNTFFELHTFETPDNI
jgi:hypothetical protein